jgi:RND family efflux transporter MFP subunit
MNLMKKLFVASLIPTILTGCSAPVSGQRAIVETATIHNGKLPQDLKLTGTLLASEELDVSAKAGGKVVSINVDTGDRVSTNNTLLSLDATTEKATQGSLMEVSAVGTQGKDALEKLYDDRINSAKKQLQTAKDSGNSALLLIQKQIDEAENNTLPSTTDVGQASIDTLTTQLESAKHDLKTASENALASSDLLLSQINDKLYEVYVPDENVDRYSFGTNAQQYFESLYSSYKHPAQTAISKLQIDFKDFHVLYQTLLSHTNATDEEIDTTVSKALEVLNDAKNSLDLTYEILVHESPSPGFSLEDMNQYKIVLNSFSSQVEPLIQSLKNLYGSDGISGQIAVLTKQEELAKAQAIASKNGVASQIVVLKEQLAKAQVDIEGQIQQTELGISTLEKEKTAKLLEAETSIVQLNGQQNINATLINNSIVTSPFSGVITQKFVEIGAVVSPGMPLFHLANDSKLKLIIGVPDNFASSISVGWKAEVSIDDVTDETFEATVDKIYPSVDPVSKKVKVELSLDNKDDRLKIGSFARVHFALSDVDGVVIPSSALVSRYGLNFVYVVQEGKAISRDVVVGVRSSDLVEITSGIQEGEKIVTSGASFLRDGETIVESLPDSASTSTNTSGDPSNGG